MQNLLQLLMQSGALAEEELIELYASCVEAHRSAARAADLRVDTNVDTNRTVVDRLLREDLKAQLDPLGLKIAKMKHRDGKVYYGIANLRDDATASVANDMAKPQQEFTHKLINAIRRSSNRSIDPMDAQNMRTELEEGRMTDAETGLCLDRLVESKWLDKDSEGTFLLGVRSEMQLMYARDDAVEV